MSTDAVLRYHRASKHDLDRYAPGPGRLDWANQPDPFRTFEGADQVELPLLADGLDVPFSRVRVGAAPERPVDGNHLALLLELSMGLSAWKSYAGSRWALRCNPSSGNLHPTEAYVVAPRLPGLDGGVYHYVSRSHVLERRAVPREPDWSGAFPVGGVLVGLTSIIWREAWKYGVRAYRYCQHDCGHAIAAVRYAAAALGWKARLVDVSDEQLERLLGLDRAEDFAGAERESVDALLWVGPGAAPERLAPFPVERWSGRANRLSARHVHWPGIDEVELAARRGATGDDSHRPPHAFGPGRVVLDSPAATLIRQRRSALDFDGTTHIDADAFFAMLDVLVPRANVPPLDALTWPPQVHPVFFVHRVNGLMPGLYALCRDPSAVDALRAAMRPDWLWERAAHCPEQLDFRLLLPMDLRAQARTIFCHQEIASDGVYAAGMLADFRALERGPHWYRRLFWETGAIGQVLYLEAEAAGIRATGVGCFFDDALHRLLGMDPDGRFQSLYHFTAGGPVEDARLETLPPYAHLARALP